MSGHQAPQNRLQSAGVAAPGEDWWEAFFPAELPTEWQLEYYTHHYSRLLLPAEVWTAAPFGTWEEAVPKGLQLTLEWSAGLDPVAGAVALTGLAESLGNRRFTVLLGAMDAVAATAVERALQARPEVARVWAGPAQPRPLSGAREALWYPAREGGGEVWQITPEVGLDAPGWRRLVEDLAVTSGAGEVSVFLRVRPDRLSDFRTLAQLLGRY